LISFSVVNAMSAVERPLEQIRNIGIIAHIDAGKTTTTERMLYYSGATHRMGEVDKGTTETDFDPEEQKRGITIYGAAVSFDWRDVHVNLIDTPGHVDFTAEVERALRVLDGAVCVFSAREGVEAQSETVWKQADKYRVPRICFINKLDREGADFEGTFGQIRERLHANPVAIEMPVGIGPSHGSDPFRGIVDLVSMKMISFDLETKGKVTRDAEIPDDLLPAAQEWRARMLEELSNYDDELMTLILEEAEVPPELIRKVARQATVEFKIQPVLCGSSLHYIGVQPLLDGVADFLPSPSDRPAVEGFVPDTKGGKRKRPATAEEEAELPREKRAPDAEEPFCGLVFKVIAEKHGDLCLTRIYSGRIKANSRVLNPRLNDKENAAQLWHIQADHKTQVQEASAGEIIGIVGLRHSVTGDTLCDPKSPILLESIIFPETVISMAIEPESSGDRKKLADTLELLKRQDPTFAASTNEETGQTIIRGMGELHLEVITHRLKDVFGLKVKVHKPRVSYRETIGKPMTLVGVCDRQIGGTTLFAKVGMKLEPLSDDVTEPTQLVDQLSGPRADECREVLVDEVSNRLSGSGMTGHPLSKLKVTLTSVEIPEEEAPNETALRVAVADAFNQALESGNVVVLEPLMKVEVSTPPEYVGNIVGDLQQRRGLVTDQAPRGALVIIRAEVPLEELFGYSGDVRSRSGGRASFSMEPYKYAAAPNEVRDRFL
jgi:elongation factor G